MAIIQLGITVVGIRGTVGGITFSANKSGPYARLWSRSANPQTTFQSPQRSRIAQMPQLWRALTPAEQTTWDVFAALPAQDRINRLGETFSASGFIWFVIINTRLLRAGRSPRTGPPIQARPAAPTISSLQLPFLPTQYAQVTYPSGEFDPDFDIVIECAVAISTGRISPVTTFLLLKELQNPGDTATGFQLPYLERIALQSEALKGFVRVYRQTTDGLRSSAGTATFISTDSPGFAAAADDYNGTTNFALRGADLTGNANSKICLCSIWFRVDGGDGTPRQFLIGNPTRYVFTLNAANQVQITLRNAAAANILQANTTTTFLAGAAWHNVIWSIDLATLTAQLLVDGTLETPTFTTSPINDTIDWTNANHSFGAVASGVQFYDGCLSNVYLNNVDRIDLTIPANIRLFIDPSGNPVDLGPDGSFPTDTVPIVYTLAADPSANLGSGGNYVNQAGLAACSTTP